MECTKVREACSAVLDSEPANVPTSVIAGHLRTCESCRAFATDARAMRAVLSAGAVPMTDLAPQIATATRARRGRGFDLAVFLRLGLVAVAVAQLALALPGLVFGTDEGAPIHIAHEVGAWDLALAVGFLFAAWRPLRAVGLLPFVAALSAGLIGTAVLDVADGRANSLMETTHLLELVGTVLLWMLVAPRVGRRAALRIV
jgi:predicted anti-sigma-YlaC factor YlaD